MSTPESTPTHLPTATLCQSQPQPYARVDFIPQSGTLDLASGNVEGEGKGTGSEDGISKNYCATTQIHKARLKIQT
jgi:hypothetical protein